MIVPLFGIGLQGKSSTVTSERRVNCYIERSKDNDKGPFAIHGTPGLESFIDLEDYPFAGNPTANHVPPIRGMFVHGGQLRVIVGAIIYAFVPTLLYGCGSTGLATTGSRVDAAVQEDGSALIVDGNTRGAIVTYYPSSLLGTDGVNANNATPVSDTDAPISSSVAFEAGNLIVNKTSSGRFYISADGTTWDALDFANAESSPDNLIRVMVDHGELHLFGESTTEFWSNTGAADFPYGAIRGATIEWGLAAEASAAKFDSSIVFLGNNRLGQRQIVQLRGYQAAVISDQELDSILSGYDSVSDAYAFSYNHGGHPFYQINFTSANASWLYDGSTQVWTQLTDANGNRHRAQIAVNWNGETVVSDYLENKLYKLKSGVYQDAGAIIPREIVTRHFFQNYERVFIDMLQLDFDVGVGLTSGQGSDPQVMLQVSKDNGKSWGSELWRSLGAIGATNTRVIWRQLGSGRDWVFRFRLTDPVKFVITEANLHYTPGIG